MRRIDKYNLDTIEGMKKLYKDYMDSDTNAIPSFYRYIDYIYEEIPTKKRWETYNGDFLGASSDFNGNSKCSGCEFQKCDECFAVWLMGEVEVCDEAN